MTSAPAVSGKTDEIPHRRDGWSDLQDAGMIWRQITPSPDDDAPAIFREPSACGGCHTVRKIVARAWRTGALVDLCVQCTAVEIEHRRARGQHVPEGFGWVK